MANFKHDYFPLICLPGRLNRITDYLIPLKQLNWLFMWTQARFKSLECLCRSQRVEVGGRGKQRARLRKGNPTGWLELWARINSVL